MGAMAITGPQSPTVRRAITATYIAFIGSGFAFASWASRIPQVQDALGLDPQTLGFVLLALAAGSVTALPLGGVIINRIGATRTIQVMAALEITAFVIIGIGHQFGLVPLVIGLAIFGFGHGAWDVAMNVHGAVAERELGRSVMARFHAGFSVGTVAGAGVGAGMVALGVPVMWHLIGVAVVIGAVVPYAVRNFLAADSEPTHADDLPAAPKRSAFAAWREPRTILIGVFVLAFSFAEGTGNDWIAVALIDDLKAPEALGTLGFAIFLTAMTVSRWIGPGILDRYGRVAVVRVMGVMSLVGVLLFIAAPSLPVAFVGATLWGFGLALGFPLGMSAGADDPAHAAARVSVIASIGYCSFLAGPPLIGVLGQHFTVHKALLPVAVLLAIAMAIAGAVREPKKSLR